MENGPVQPKMKVVYEFGRWVCDSGYELRHWPKEAGFHWDPRRRAWTTRKAKVAAGLIAFADADAKKRIQDALFGPGYGHEESMAAVGRGGGKRRRPGGW